MKEKVKKTGVKKTLEIVFYAILAVLFTFIIITAVTLMRGGTPSFFGYSFMFVKTGSMKPFIPEASVIMVENLDESEIEELEIGDVIVFYSEKENKLITHRIVEIDFENKTLVTLGDDNHGAKDDPTSFSNVKAKYVARFKALSVVTAFLKKPIGFFLCIILPTLVLIVCYIVSIGKASSKLSIEKEKEARKQREEELKKQAVEEFLAEKDENKPLNAAEKTDAENQEKTDNKIE